MKDVIVMGGNYSLTLGVTRSLGETGFNVKLLVADKWTERIAGSSKYVTKCCNCLGNSENEESSSLLKGIHNITSVLLGRPKLKTEVRFDQIWAALEQLRGNNEHILIIPVSDPYCLMLDEQASKFSEHYYIPNCFGKPGKVAYYMDKMVQKNLARQCDLKTAWGNIYSTYENGVRKAVQEVKFPCFMKVLLSAKVFKGKNLYTVCKNKEELQNAMGKASSSGCSKVLIEEFLDIEKDICVYGVAGNNHVYIPGCLETIRGGYGRHKGVTIEGMVCSAAWLGETKGKLEEFVKRIGLTGLFCIDLAIIKGEVFFIEMNLRSGASIYGVTLTGANLPGILAEMIYSNTYKKPANSLRTSHFLSEMIELDAYADGFLTHDEYNRHMSDVQERFIKNDVDPEPWKIFQKLEFRKRVVKCIRMLKS